MISIFSKLTHILALLLLLNPLVSNAKQAANEIPEINNAGVLFVDNQGKALISRRSQTAFIPASTTKLITAWLALQHWGEEYHFETDFYLDKANKTLWVKGSGDPFLVSEELLIIAKQLSKLGIKQIDTIGLDVSLFQPDLISPGASATNNPYDAIPSAVAANFNTVTVKKSAGKVVSAEKQTPLTPLAERIATRTLEKTLGMRKSRINTGQSSQEAERYFAELLATFLNRQGIKTKANVIWGKVEKQTVFYKHINSKSLGELTRLMMKYSTNFIANQLVLKLSAEHYRRPANFSDVQNYMESTLHQHFKWQDFTIKDGAGLSRDNRLSPQQLIELLNSFNNWKHLLPEVAPGVFAKSGTLNKVSTLAGYISDKKRPWQPFALMMSQSVPHRRRNQIASALANR